MTERLCNECGIPMSACNAFTFYRMAANQLEMGDIDRARESMAAAKECYDEFIRTARTNA